MKHILDTLASLNKIPLNSCDETLLEYQDFLSKIATVNVDFENFDYFNSRVDNFLGRYISENKNNGNIWKIIKLLLIISHGQSSVERGFSINKLVEVENLKEENYIAKRIINDQMKHCGGMKNFTITKELRIAVSGARQKYLFYLEEQKKEKESESKKRKSCSDELQNLKTKKIILEKSISSLLKSADDLALKAENTNNIKYIVQSNSFRRTANEKNAELEDINTKICEKRMNVT